MLNSIQTPVRQNLANQNNNAKIKAAFGAIVGTVIPVAIMMKKQNIQNPLKLEYNLKDMLVLSSASIMAGTASGMINEPLKSKENKIKEGTFQLLNAAFPAILSSIALKFCKSHKQFDSAIFKIISVLTGITTGMFMAVKTANKIFDPNDKNPDRKLSPKDCIASIDDAIGALALAKFPIVQKLHFDKLLPVIYAYCGYRAGKTN